jgi:hypothetical protein
MERASGFEKDKKVVKDAANVVRPDVVPICLPYPADHVPALSHVAIVD